MTESSVVFFPHRRELKTPDGGSARRGGGGLGETVVDA